jgi:adenylate cyclase
LVRLRSEETRRALEEKHERDRLRATLERYFTPQVAHHLLENPGALGGKLQEATIVVADVRDFTRMSETLGPVKTVQFLNALFEKMVEIVFRHGGTLDKYLGDGMLIVFGVPQPRPDDAIRAMKAAVEMARAAESVGEWTGITLGCAVHSGEVLMGNVGSASRMEFTVIGDVVNTTCRMEQLNRQFRTSIIFSESVRARVGDRVQSRPLPATSLRGKSEFVPLYEFTGWSPEETSS